MHTKELVVAVCKEDLSWIDNTASNYDKVTVYDKCGAKMQFYSPNVEVKAVQNIGSCDNAYLSYIIDRYDTLPSSVDFTKGSKSDQRPLPIRCNGCGSRGNILGFSLGGYSFTNNKTQAFEFVKSPHENMRAWVENDSLLSVDMYEESSCNTIYQGHFSAYKEQIQNMPIKVYENLKAQQKHANEEIDHFIERSWATMFCTTKAIP